MKSVSATGLLERYETDIQLAERQMSEIDARRVNAREQQVADRLAGELEQTRYTLGRLMNGKRFLVGALDPRVQLQDAKVEKWDERFFTREQIHARTDMWLDGDERCASVWKQMPDSLFKRVQEGYTRPKRYTYMAFHPIDDKHLAFPEGHMARHLPLAAASMDIDLVPDSILEHLKIVKFDPKEDDLLHVRRKLLALPSFKGLLERMEPLAEGNNRIYIVRGTDINDPNIDMRVQVIDRDAVGSILYNRSDEKRKKKKERMKDIESSKRAFQYMPHVFPAHRKTFHQIEKYVYEIDTMSDLVTQLDHLIWVLDQNWKKETPNAEKNAMKEETRRLLALCDKSLRRCKNSFKVDAHDRVEKSEDLMGDDDIKPMISAVMACMVSTKNLLGKRFEDMKEKGKANYSDQAVLQKEITDSTKQLKIHHAGVLRLSESLDTEIEGEKIPFYMNIESLNRLRVEPFLTCKELLVDKHEILCAQMANGKDGEAAAKETLIEMHLVHKFLEVLTTFEDIKQSIIYAGQLSVTYLRESVESLRTVFSTFQIFPDVIVEEYVPAYTEMSDRLKRMEERLKYYETIPMNLDERRELFGRLKEFLDGIDILKILRSFRDLERSEQTTKKPR